MVLAFDVGNTNIKIGLFEGDDMIYRDRKSTRLNSSHE